MIHARKKCGFTVDWFFWPRPFTTMCSPPQPSRLKEFQMNCLGKYGTTRKPITHWMNHFGSRKARPVRWKDCCASTPRTRRWYGTSGRTTTRSYIRCSCDSTRKWAFQPGR
ncbi:uncharacterized protein LOC126265592 [Aethina tumida]|uniref:uncharacterized protein LOC126265592 n=1 Tax=Aethina tumida TaxID=116153 RepID=UPI0021485196|nr:uncharacterized protein LOC126265592 [Aethina tumida]